MKACIILTLWVLVFIIIFFPAPPKQVLCIIGEAEDQDYWGMMAVAHAIRNRGCSVKGCNGVNSLRVKQHLYSDSIYRQAEMAWKDSEVGYDYTEGANHWYQKRIKKPWKDCKITYTYKDHVFCKEE